MIEFVSSRLRQFEVRLMMAQGIQPIPAESGPGPTGPWDSQQETSTPLGARVCGPCPLMQEEVSEEETFGPFPLKNKGVESLRG